VRWQRKNIFKFYLGLAEPDNWLLIFGDQGSAITENAQKIIRGLKQNGKAVIIFDTEGIGNPPRDFDRIMRPGDRDNPLRLNILEEDFSEDISEEIEIVTRIFTESLNLSPEQSQTLWEAFRSIYRGRQMKKKVDLGPAISFIIAEIQKNIDPRRVQSESFILLMKKLVQLAEGKLGEILNQRNSIRIRELLRGTTLIELGQLRDIGVKRLLVSIVLASLGQAIKAEASGEQGHQLFLVLKESGPILREGRREQSIIKQTLLEFRRRGVGLLLIQRSLREIPRYLIDRCRTRICHRLTDMEDVDLAHKILNLSEDQAALLLELSDREAVVKTSDYAQPFLAWIPGSDLPSAEKMAGEPIPEEDVLEIILEQGNGLEEESTHSEGST